MAIYSYQDLEVYRERFTLAVRVHKETEKFPESERFGMTNQIRRSSKGVCATIAEGFGQKEHKNEFRRLLRMAHGSVQETKVWIEFAIALGFWSEQEGNDLWRRYDSLGKRLYTLARKWE